MDVAKQTLRRYTLFGLGAILLWSATIALARSLTEQVGSLTAAAAVHLTGGAFCVGYLLLSRGATRRLRNLPRKYVLCCGTLFVVYMCVLFLAIGLARDRSQVLEIGLVNYLWPSLTLLFSLFLLNKRAGYLLVPGTLFALLGVYLVVNQGGTLSPASLIENLGDHPLVYGLALLAAISWALYSNLTRRWVGEAGAGGVALFLPATGVILLVFRLLNPEVSEWSTRAWAEILLMGLATALAYGLWDGAMRKGDVVFVAACSYFTPLFSTVLTCLYLGVRAGTVLWIGCALIVAGSLMSWFSVSDRGSGHGKRKEKACTL